MKALCYYEIRKFMSIKGFLIISFFVIMCPMLMALENVTGKHEVDAYKDAYAHEINADWLNEVQAKVEALNKEEERLVETSNGALSYGGALSEDDQNLYQALVSAMYTGRQIVLQEYLYKFDSVENSEKHPYAVERAAYEKSLYADLQTSFFGSTMGADFIIISLWYGGIALGIYFLYLFSRVFNEEYRGQFYDLLKTTKQGKRVVAKVKLCTILGISTGFASVYMGLTFLIAFLFLHPQLDIVMAASDYASSIIYMTFQDAVLMASILFITALFAFSMIASFISSIVKSTFVSLAASLLFFMLPIFMQQMEIAGTEIFACMPSNLILLNNTVYMQPFGFLQGQGYLYYQVMPIFWLFISCMIGSFIYVKFQRRART